MSEYQVQNIIFENLRKKYKFVFKEVAILSRCADLIFVNEDDRFISLEIKLNNWRKAILQALDHQLVVDESYICIPYKKKGVSKKLLDNIANTGIGVYVFNIEDRKISLEKIKEAERSSFYWEQSRSKLRDMLYE